MANQHANGVIAGFEIEAMVMSGASAELGGMLSKPMTVPAVPDVESVPIKLKGPYLLVRMRPPVPKIGLVHVPETKQEVDANAHVVCQVVAMSEDAWQDSDPCRFPSGPRCQIGDLVLMAAFTGYRYKLKDRDDDYRLVNDNGVMAVVEDWDAIEKAK